MDELVASTLAIQLPCAHLFHPQVPLDNHLFDSLASCFPYRAFVPFAHLLSFSPRLSPLAHSYLSHLLSPVPPPQCLREWLSKNHTCPTCRAKLPTRAEKEASRQRRDDDAPPRSWADYSVTQAGLAPPISGMYT